MGSLPAHVKTSGRNLFVTFHLLRRRCLAAGSNEQVSTSPGREEVGARAGDAGGGPDEPVRVAPGLKVRAPAEPTAPTPVLFWFYGGALPHGSGSLYDGAWPAAVCDAVVVTVNYRLDPPAFDNLAGLPPATPMSPAGLAVTAPLHRAAPSRTPALPRAPQQPRPVPLRATGPRHGDPGRPGPGSYTTPVANAASSPGPRPEPRADHPASLCVMRGRTNSPGSPTWGFRACVISPAGRATPGTHSPHCLKGVGGPQPRCRKALVAPPPRSASPPLSTSLERGDPHARGHPHRGLSGALRSHAPDAAR
ncbi:carboxylesterase family protein [Streptomyces bluensis]|uniref:carboxylesterase family protein n=1 Tax=Streptomyces bluensis TaxID=33897 RepID=UPI003679A577